MNETTPTTAALPGKEAETVYRTNGEREECEAAGDAASTEDQYEEEDDDDDDEDVTDDEEDIFFDQSDSNPHEVHRKDSYKEPMGERIVCLLSCKVAAVSHINFFL